MEKKNIFIKKKVWWSRHFHWDVAIWWAIYFKEKVTILNERTEYKANTCVVWCFFLKIIFNLFYFIFRPGGPFRRSFQSKNPKHPWTENDNWECSNMGSNWWIHLTFFFFLQGGGRGQSFFASRSTWNSSKRFGACAVLSCHRKHSRQPFEALHVRVRPRRDKTQTPTCCDNWVQLRFRHTSGVISGILRPSRCTVGGQRSSRLQLLEVTVRLALFGDAKRGRKQRGRGGLWPPALVL